MVKNQQQLALAIEIATQAHSGQFDKGGKPYILHPLHIMQQLMFDVELAIVGVLHDVVEDGGERFSLHALAELGFSQRVLQAITLLTHDSQDDYLGVYIKNICTNYDAIRVKRKDLAHNSDITRLIGVGEKDFAAYR